MKKSLLFVASLVVSAASFAQWTAPVPANIQDMATDGTAQFLYNAEAGGFFAGANDWNTRASVSSTPDSIRFEVADGENYNFLCYPTAAAKNKWLYVSCNQFDAMWVDAPNAVSNDAYPGTDAWRPVKQADGSYKIYNDSWTSSNNPVMGIAEFYEGKTGNTRTYIYDDEATYVVNDEVMPSFSGNFYDKWYFIDAEEYEALKPRVEAYLASQALAARISDAKAADPKHDFSAIDAVYNNTSSTVEELKKAEAVAVALFSFINTYNEDVENYPNLDFSAQKAVYDNTASTAEEIAEAEAELQAVISNSMAANATFDDPIDFSEVIGNGSAVDPWKREFTGEGEVGTWHTNTWSTEANGGADGTDMTTPFCEDWVGSGSLLSDQKVFQVLKSAAPGLYKFEVNVRLYNEAGGVDALTGCNMYFGDQSVTLDEQVEMYKSGNKCVLWNKNKFHIIAVVKEAGDIEFGFDIKDATFNWMAFKETSLLYYGNENVEENAAKLVKESYSFEPLDEEEVIANRELIKAYNDAVEAYEAAVSMEDIKAAVAAAEVAQAAIDANIAAYKEIVKSVNAIETELSSTDLNGLIEIFADFMNMANDEESSTDCIDGIKEEVAALGVEETIATIDSLFEIVTMSPAIATAINGQEAYVEGMSLSYTTEQAQAYADALYQLYSICMSHSLYEGADCTAMLVNPAFTDNNGKGWTQAFKAGNLAWTGGIVSFPVAESWHSTFDIYQEVEAPDGIYSVSLNGFCRLDDGVDATVPAEIYLNEFATPLMEITQGKIPMEDAVDGFNCYLTNGASGAWTSNPIFNNEDGTPVSHKSPNDATDSDDGEGYWPNGMEGASVAFSAGRYEAKVYGIVEGGKMKLGVRNLKSTHVWALWSNFKLTYEGKNDEAVAALANAYVEKADELYNEEMTTPAQDALYAAIAAVNDAAGDGEAQYEAIKELNRVVVATKENVAALAAFNEAKDAMNEIFENYGENATEDAQNKYYDLAELDASDMTTEEILAATDKIIACQAALKIPAYAEASDENPIDFTQVIVNPDFQENTAQQQATGWTLVKGEGASGNYQVQNGFDGVGMEFWSNTNGSGTKFDFYQKLANLPAGTYVLTVEASNSLNGQTAGPGTGAAYIYASAVAEGAEPRQLISDPIEVQEEGCTAKYGEYAVTITLKEGEELVIGAMNIGELSARWVMIDNFHLYYYGTESEQKESVPVAIEDAASNATIAAIYNAAGQKVSKAVKGINFVKMSDNTVKKVYVK